jgi:hypothetical protein
MRSAPTARSSRSGEQANEIIDRGPGAWGVWLSLSGGMPLYPATPSPRASPILCFSGPQTSRNPFVVANDMTPPVCAVCRAEIEARKGPGRRAVYCGPLCRWKAWDARQKAKLAAELRVGSNVIPFLRRRADPLGERGEAANLRIDTDYPDAPTTAELLRLIEQDGQGEGDQDE